MTAYWKDRFHIFSRDALLADVHEVGCKSSQQVVWSETIKGYKYNSALENMGAV